MVSNDCSLVVCLLFTVFLLLFLTVILSLTTGLPCLVDLVVFLLGEGVVVVIDCELLVEDDVSSLLPLVEAVVDELD